MQVIHVEYERFPKITFLQFDPNNKTPFNCVESKHTNQPN